MAQYRIAFYEGLRDTLGSHDIQLTVLYGRADDRRAQHADEVDLPWGVPTPVRRFPIGWRRQFTWQPVLRATAGADLVIVEAANRHLTNYALLLRSLLRPSNRVAFWGHGRDRQSHAPDGALAAWKAWLNRSPSWWFAYTRSVAETICADGFPDERITVVQNSADTTYFGSARPKRQEHGTVFVGSLHEHKRISFLLEAVRFARRDDPLLTLDVLGAGPSANWRDETANAASRTGVTFKGPVFGHEKALALKGASLMLMPGLVGLAAVDSFAAGTPIVTTAIKYHSPEVDYLVDGVNAFVLPETTTPKEYAAFVVELLHDQKRLAAAREACYDSARVFSLDEMVRRFATGVLEALS